MERRVVNDADLEKVVGGTIIFSPDHSTCGYFCNDQYRVNDYASAVSFIQASSGKMSERNMLKQMKEKGYISDL